MSLEDILNKFREENPNEFDSEALERVRGLVEYEAENPGKKKPRNRFLEEIADWILYYKIHPEWQGKSTEEMVKDKESGAKAFYQAFKGWIRKETDDKEARKELVQMIFKPKHRDWSSNTTLDDWIEEYNKHPEWHGKSTKEMGKDKESGARSFYDAFLRWSKKITVDEEKRKELIQSIFDPKLKDWSSHTTLDDWVDEYNKNPEWHGKSTGEMNKDKESGANAFYQAFSVWAKKESTDMNGNVDEEKRKELVQRIFKPKHRDLFSYILDDWVDEYNKHPEWHGKSTGEMKRDKESGARSFYDAFLRWTRKVANNEEERKAIRKIFLTRRSSQADDPKVSINKKLGEGDIPEKLRKLLIEVVDEEILGIELITLSTMAGFYGGGVGRVSLPEERRSYVFKVETNEKAAYKSSQIPAKVFERAETDEMAKELSGRIPRPLFSTPAKRKGFYVTLAEDVSGKGIQASSKYLKIMALEFGKELKQDMLDKLYTTALYHEVVTEICEGDEEEIIKIETFPTNIHLEQLKARFGTRLPEVKHIFDKLESRYDNEVAELLAHQRGSNTQAIGDNKKENYVNNLLVDFGLSKQGDEIDDLARLFMDNIDICSSKELLEAYVDSYVAIRQGIQKYFRGYADYAPNATYLKQLVIKQTGIDAVRNAGWAVMTDRSASELSNYCNCADAVSQFIS